MIQADAPSSLRGPRSQPLSRRLRPESPCTLIKREVEEIKSTKDDYDNVMHFDHEIDDNGRRDLGLWKGFQNKLQDRIRTSYQQSQQQHDFGLEWFCALSDEDSQRADGAYFVPIQGLGAKFFEDNHIRSGMTTLTASGAYLENGVLQVPLDAIVNLGKPNTMGQRAVNDNQERRLTLDTTRSTGQKRVLVVRVISSDSSTSASAAQLSEGIFGNNNVNLKTQYEACSAGAMTIQPAQGPNIVNGVATVSISKSTNGRPMGGAGGIDTDVSAAATSLLGNLATSSQWDYVMYCMPAGTAPG